MDLQHSLTHMVRYCPAPQTNAEPNAFTAECELVRQSVSFLGIKTIGFGAQLRLRHGHGMASLLPRNRTLGNPSLVQGRSWALVALENPARVRLRTGNIWFEFRTIRGPLTFLSLRRSARFRRTLTFLEARQWLVDFHVAAALDSFPFFFLGFEAWVFLLGLFVTCSAFGLGCLSVFLVLTTPLVKGRAVV